MFEWMCGIYARVPECEKSKSRSKRFHCYDGDNGPKLIDTAIVLVLDLALSAPGTSTKGNPKTGLCPDSRDHVIAGPTLAHILP